MSAPISPALVRAALKPLGITLTYTERRALEKCRIPGGDADILREHIRAVAQEMRQEVDALRKFRDLRGRGNIEKDLIDDHIEDMEKFADKLEGKES